MTSLRAAFAARIVALALASAAGARATLWVSPSGDDGGKGTEEAPFRTIEHARDVVRGLNRNMDDDITVFIAGTYHVDRPIEFGPLDGATNGFSIIYTAAPDERPTVTGAFHVTGWSVSDAAHNVWSAPAPDGLTQARDLYVNGTPVAATSGRMLQVFARIGDANRPAEPEGASQWKNPSDVSFDPADPEAVWSERGAGAPIFVRNAIELLGTPGQWYLDRTARRVYYAPRPGENLAGADVEAASALSLIAIRGTADRPVMGLVFKGLRFAFTSRPDMETGLAAAGVSVAYCGGVQFLEDQFLHMDSFGLGLGPGVSGTVVDGCLFSDTAWSAVRIAASSQVRISESRISYAACRHVSEGAVELDGAQDVTIDHDQVDHFPRVAILRVGAPSGTVLEDSNDVAQPMIVFRGTPEEAPAAAPQDDARAPYRAILNEAVATPTIPGPPTGVSAEAEDEFAYVTWMPSCLDGGSPVTAYTVASTTGAKMTVTSEDFQAKGYVVFDNLENGRAVAFTVSAANAQGSSPPSLATANVKPLLKRKLKTAPAPAQVSVTTRTSGVNVRIFPPVSDGGSPVISYSVSAGPDERDVLEGLDVIHADAAHPVQRRIDGASLAHAPTITIVATNIAGDGDPATVKLR